MEYNYVKRQTLALTNVDLNCYKAPQMQRRLKTYLSRSGHSNWARFFRAIQTNPADLNNFKDYLTINVSAFFRDKEKFKALELSILPELLRQRDTLRVWSAGCSRGQEAYSLAMLLAEATPSKSQHRLLATDIDQSALAWAKAGGPYLPDHIDSMPAHLYQRYFYSKGNQYWVTEALRQRVMFQQHNLLADPMIGKFDLIVCRNVVIYFQPEAKETLYQRFFDALKPGGVLFVGGTEIIPKATNMGFESVDISFYRRRA